MREIVYRYDPGEADADGSPPDASAARTALVEGNRRFADLFHAPSGDNVRQVVQMSRTALGTLGGKGGAPAQAPFAVVLSCADARVPVELVFQRAANDVFVVRVAGNVLGAAGLGSIQYAMSALAHSVWLAVVLGHTKCGAVTAAADAFLEPGSYPDVAPTPGLRAVVDRLILAVRGAGRDLEAAWGPDVAQRPGYRDALIETAVVLNAALTAATLCRELGDFDDVVFGVYDLATMEVRLPLAGLEHGGLADAPTDEAGLKAVGLETARSDVIRQLLDGA